MQRQVEARVQDLREERAEAAILGSLGARLGARRAARRAAGSLPVLGVVAGLLVGSSGPVGAEPDAPPDPAAINERLYEQLDHGANAGRIERVAGQLYVSERNLDPAVLGEAVARLLEDDGAREENVALPRTHALNLDIHFKKNSAELSEAARRGLDALGEVLREQHAAMRFQLGGHTDGDGDETVNRPLSRARAEAARRYLIDSHGIAPERLEARGFGASEPLHPVERTREDKRYNRRVDVRPLRGGS